MKERPILFSAPMVRAILEGRKTQTRRDAKFVFNSNGDRPLLQHCPYGQPGDRLWVRETWDHDPAGHIAAMSGEKISDFPAKTYYRADGGKPGMRWRPSIHMPRWASRILLEITAVRVERLQDISEGDARAEGCQAIQGCYWHTFEEAAAGIPMHKHTAIDTYSALWESINGAGSWDANPWVWVVEFKRVTPC